jgi:hypothetical protein
MSHAVAVAAAEQTHFIGPLRDVWQEVGNLDAAFSARFEFAAGRKQFVFGDGAARFEMAERFRDRLTGEFDEIGLGIEQVDMAWSARHEKENDSLGFRWKMRGFGRERIFRSKQAVLAEQ